MKDSLSAFSNRLENARDRIEGASRLHHLLGLDLKEDDDIQQEMQNLADKIGDAGLVEKCKENASKNAHLNAVATSTPNATSGNAQLRYSNDQPSDPSPVITTNTKDDTISQCECWRNPVEDVELRSNTTHKLARSLINELAAAEVKSKQFRTESEDDDDDEEEDHSKMADSGLGYCERCEGNEKLTRSCSCQSFDEPTNASSKR